ncbi:MAG: restriction endonuclease subunit S [Cyanobacteria bacterium P01_H01_bin.153]
MSFPLVEISEVANFINGFAFKPGDWEDEGTPIIRIQNLTDPNKPYNFTQKKVPDKYQVKAGDILISWSATIDVFEWDRSNAFLNQHIFKVDFDNEVIDKHYFKNALKRTIFELSRYAHGSTMKHVVKKDFESHKIPLPPLDDQKRIAYLLGKVEGAIAQRQQHLEQLGDLLKSVFLEMFGDPLRNEKGWELDDFEAITESARNGLSPSRAGATKGLVYTLSAITGNTFKETFKEDQFTKIKDTYFPSADDFLVCRGNGNINLVGKGYFYPGVKDNIMFPDTMIGVKIRADSINKRFLEHLWKSDFIRHQIEKSARTANGTYKINQKALSSIKLILPPNPIQNQFADIVQKVESIKSRYQQSLTDLESLYGALSQKAFKGELDLSRIPLPSEDTDTTAAEPSETSETSEPQSTTETFNLPAPPELTTLQSSEGRHALINQWLTAWLDHLNNAPFSPQPFMEAAQQRLMELSEEEDLPEWSIAEYNSVQAWVFEALGDLRLTQTYDDAKNRVQLHAASSR